MALIKAKQGFCLDCPPGAAIQPLTAKRCRTHYWKHRAAVNTPKAKPERKPKKKIKQISAKMAAELRKYHKLRNQHIRQHPICQAKKECQGNLSIEIHHKRGRGIYLCDTTTFLAVCRNCHDWCEAFPVEAKILGLSASRLSVNND